jgi:hypothetical protein
MAFVAISVRESVVELFDVFVLLVAGGILDSNSGEGTNVVRTSGVTTLSGSSLDEKDSKYSSISASYSSK